MMGKMFNAMFFIFAACSAGHAMEEADASCDSQEDATSQLQLHSGEVKSKNKDSMSPWCLTKSCSEIATLCLKRGKCCERAKVCRVANPCKGKNPDFPGTSCFFPNGTASSPFEQSGINVTEGFEGLFDSDGREPITTPFEEQGMCNVNVHWHAGTEHYSVGQYDLPPPVKGALQGGAVGTGPTYEPIDLPPNDGDFAGLQIPASEGVASLLQAPARVGFRCHYYSDNINNPAFTTEYNWKYCVGMHVGETYEVHWPASAAGACGTPWQYQTPFPDGLFCRDGIIDGNKIWEQIGVQGQVFTVVNDDDYYFPDLIKGPIRTGTHWKDVAYYTGSSTGTTYNNTYCSQYAPITWQVDRKCHLISASAFDNMCKDMMKQAASMTEDLPAHGSRERVLRDLAADNIELVEDSVDEPRAF